MIEHKLAQARVEYGRKLGARLSELARLIGSFRASGDEAALAQARLLAHRLCGTAGSFGFSGVSQALSVVDAELTAVLGGLDPTDALWQRIDAALERAQAGSVS